MFLSVASRVFKQLNSFQFIFIYKILSLNGFWPSQSWSNWKKCFYNFYSYFLAFICCCQFIFQALHIFFKSKNLQTLLTNLIMMSTVVNAVIRLGSLRSNRSQVIELVKELFHSEPKIIDDGEAEIRKHYRQYNEVFFVTLCMSYLSFCIIYHSTRPHGSEYAVEVWIPNFIINFFPTWILRALSHIAWAILALGLLAYDQLFCAILIQTAMHIDVLKYRLKNVPMHDAGKRRQALLNCVQYHVAICEIRQKIESTFLIVISALPVVFAINMCLGIYQATLWDTNDTATLTAFVLFSTSVFLEGFSVCWVASDITYKSAEIGNAVYEMDWIGIDKYTGKMMIILMSYSTSRPMRFVGILSISMSNNTFREILNMSYQFYLLLRHIAHSKKN